MTDLEKYEAVNKCETLEQLADVILSFADEDGNIQGRTRKFHAEKMAAHALTFNFDKVNTLTREYGIRQQGMYIVFYISMSEAINSLMW